MEKVVIEITRQDVEGLLTSNHFKATPELVTEILKAIQKSYESGDYFPDIYDGFLWDEPIYSMLESE